MNIYIFSSDNDGGNDLQAFSSEEKLDEYLRRYISEQIEQLHLPLNPEQDVADLLGEYNELYDRHHDIITTDCVEVDGAPVL